jgi:hypothetical protein
MTLSRVNNFRRYYNIKKIKIKRIIKNIFNKTRNFFYIGYSY